MGISKIFQRIVFYILMIIGLFVISNFLVYPISIVKEKIGEYYLQIIRSSLFFIIFLMINCVRILKDNDLRRDVTAIINKSEKEYSLRNTYIGYMKKYGIMEIISFMAAMFIIILLYVNINTKIDNVMNEVFIYMYNLIKFIYSNDLPLGSFNTYIILNYILIVSIYIIVFNIVMCYIITKCEENRLHKVIKK